MKTLKLWFRVGDLDLPEGRKKYTSGREEEEGVDEQIGVPSWQTSREWNSHTRRV